jgi:hypothetical protein
MALSEVGARGGFTAGFHRRPSVSGHASGYLSADSKISFTLLSEEGSSLYMGFIRGLSVDPHVLEGQSGIGSDVS